MFNNKVPLHKVGENINKIERKRCKNIYRKDQKVVRLSFHINVLKI